MGPVAEPSPLLRRRSLSSRTEAIDIKFSDLHKASKAAGGSINDAYLAGLCGALRLYHEAKGIPVDTLPMAVPVNLRSDDDPSGGNRFAGVNLAAPVGVVDPAKRIQKVRAQMTQQARGARHRHGRRHGAGAQPAARLASSSRWRDRSSTPTFRPATCPSTRVTRSSPGRRSCGTTGLDRCPASR